MIGVTDAFGALGFGQQVVVVATLGLMALYLLRMRKVTKSAGSALGIGWFMAMAVLASFSLAIWMGWVDPFPTSFANDVTSFVSTAWDTLRRFLGDIVP